MMTACWIEDLPDEEIVKRLVDRGGMRNLAEVMAANRADPEVHDALHRLLGDED